MLKAIQPRMRYPDVRDPRPCPSSPLPSGPPFPTHPFQSRAHIPSLMFPLHLRRHQSKHHPHLSKPATSLTVLHLDWKRPPKPLNSLPRHLPRRMSPTHRHRHHHSQPLPHHYLLKIRVKMKGDYLLWRHRLPPVLTQASLSFQPLPTALTGLQTGQVRLSPAPVIWGGSLWGCSRSTAPHPSSHQPR